MNYTEITGPDINNGLGCRITLWVSGCDICCKGCHNAGLWSFNQGQEFTDETYNDLVKKCSKPYIKGLSVLGGEPCAKKNIEEVEKIIKKFRTDLPDKDVWLYSGYTYEYLLSKYPTLFQYIDVLVDGPYIEEQRNISLAFRGSENQRVIDVKKSLEQGKVVLL